jgi:hypothetical protein
MKKSIFFNLIATFRETPDALMTLDEMRANVGLKIFFFFLCTYDGQCYHVCTTKGRATCEMTKPNGQIRKSHF